MLQKVLLCIVVFGCHNAFPVLKKLNLTEQQRKSLNPFSKPTLMNEDNPHYLPDLSKLSHGNYIALVEKSQDYFHIENNDDIKLLLKSSVSSKISWFYFPIAQFYEFFKIKSDDNEWVVKKLTVPKQNTNFE